MTTARAACAGIGDITDAVMAEVVAIGFTFTDDAPPPQLVKGVHQLLFFERMRGRQHREGERAPDGGSHLGDGACGLG
jgi:hypothetical protein